MPTRLNTNFPRLSDPDEFESLVRDICAFEWNDPNTQKFGRKGQKQSGVDVYGRPYKHRGIYRGAQCKLRTKGDQLSESKIKNEVTEARGFPHKLDKLIIVTDAPRDSGTQIIIDKINENEVKNGGFQVVIWFWDDVTERLAAYPGLIVKYYRDFYANLTSLPHVERWVDLPLQVLVGMIETSNRVSTLEDYLRFRGIQIKNLTNMPRPRRILGSNSDHIDGVAIVFDGDNIDFQKHPYLKFVGFIQSVLSRIDETCPVFILAPTSVKSSLHDIFGSLDLDQNQVQVVSFDRSIMEIADRIFNAVFSYGYSRRGGISTLEICARSISSKPDSALLDMDWQSNLSNKLFPKPEEWAEYFTPALETVRGQVIRQRNITRIQIDSHLPIPAALAIGFHFNIREARVGVWARKSGGSDFKEQFWLSDAHPAIIDNRPKWYKDNVGGTRSAILELTTYVSIHDSVHAFVKSLGLDVDKWVSMSLEVNGKSPESITERQAVAFANQVAQLIRQMNGQGIENVHLFGRIPSALGVLIGQRLQACGRIHLYWFDNPTYRFAFTLS